MKYGTRGRRRGATGLVALMTLGPLLILVGMVVYVALLRDAKGESQIGADAAALAAARELATDDMLTTDLERAKARLGRARVAAHTLARSNLAAGEPLDLDPNEANDDDGGIVFGSRNPGADAAARKTFTPAGTEPANWVGSRITAVRVMVFRSPLDGPFGGNAVDRKVVARATAELDFGVVGLRPTNDDPIPLMPVALFPARRPAPEVDEWAFDPAARAFVFGKGDGIPEFRVVIGPQTDETVRPGAFLQIGAVAFDETIDQLTRGVGRAAMGDKFRREFVLGPDNILNVVGSPACPASGSEYRNRVVAAFRVVQKSADPWVWPLASAIDPRDETVRVDGFTGARLVAAQEDGAGITLILQPSVFCSPAVVTEPRTPAPEFWATNRTVCRVRLAD